MKNKKIILLVILAIIPIIALIALYNQLPDQVPVHFDFEGNVNRYGDKNELVILALLPALIGGMMFIVPKIDPKRKSYNKFGKFYDLFQIVMMLFMNGTFFFVIYQAINPQQLNTSSVIIGMMGALFIFLGNYMPTVKPNYMFGVKTPWTLDNEVVWIKTHVLAGRTIFIGGVLTLALAFFPTEYMQWLLLPVILITFFIPIVMSYVYHKQEQEKK